MSGDGTDCNFTKKNKDENMSADEEDERPSCKFGRQCFRQNRRHFLEMAHPGDEDYIVPDMPEANEDATKCKYGRKCFRLNPNHFQKFTHPRNINIQENYKKYYLNKRNSTNSSDDSVSEVDPFECSDGSDYIPSDDEE